MHLLNNSILFSYARNFFLDKLAFDCDILHNFAMCNLSLIKRQIIKDICLAHLQSSVFKLSKDLIDSIHEEGIVAYTS